MKVRDLIRDDHQDRTSSNKLCFIIGYAVITFGYIWSVVHGFSFESATIVYAPFVGGLKALDKFLSWKYGELNAKSFN